MSLSTWVLGLSPAPTNGFLCFPAGGQPVVLQHLLYLVRLRDMQESFSFIGWPSATLSPKLERTSAVLESQQLDGEHRQGTRPGSIPHRRGAPGL